MRHHSNPSRRRRPAWGPSMLSGLIDWWAVDQSALDGSTEDAAIGSVGGVLGVVTLTEDTNKPVLKLGAGPTGRDILRFTLASSHKLVDSTVIGAALSGSGVPFSVTQVCKVTGTGSNATWGLGHGTAAQKAYVTARRNYATPLLTTYHNNDANSATSIIGAQVLMDALWHVVTWVYDGTNMLMYVDGVLQDVAKAFGNAASTFNRFSLGCVISAGVVTWPASMDWAATVVNNVALTAGDVRTLHSYFGQRYLGWTINEYILYDDFVTAQANPLTSPRTAEPGRGVWTIADTGANLSIAGDKLVISGGAAGYVTPHLYGTIRNGFAGLALTAEVYVPSSLITTAAYVGLASAVTGITGAWAVVASNYVRGCQNGAITYDRRLVGVGAQAWIDPKLVEVAIVARGATGAFVLTRRPGMTEWNLAWVDSAANLSTCVPRITSVGKNVAIGRVQLRGDLTVPTYVGYSASASAGDTISAHSDGYVEATFTAQTGVTQEIRVRYTDDDNCIVVRCDQAGSTLKILSRVGGSETELQSGSQTWTNGASYRVTILQNGDYLLASVNGTNVDTGCFSTAFQGPAPTTATLVKVSHAMTEVYSWPKSVTLGDAPCSVPEGILGVGDSITYGTGDSTATYPAGQNGYLQRLCALRGAAESPTRHANAGYTLATRLTDQPSDLAASLGAPTWIITYLGSNDVATLPSEATWKANYRTLLDAYHRKWPLASVLICKPWRRTYDAECNTVAGWINDLLAEAAYSSWCRAGMDARVTIKGADDGATMTGDGLHPNAAGHAAIATALNVIMANP